MLRIEDIVIKAKAGDQEAIVLILENFKPYILKISGQYSIYGHDNYDVLQICYIALIKAIDLYKIDTKNFNGYACTTVKNTLRCLSRDNKKHDICVSMEEPIPEYEDCTIGAVLESSCNLEEQILQKFKREDVLKQMGRLNARDFELIYMLYFNDIDLRQYAVKKNIKYRAAVQRKNRAMKKLKQKLMQP